MQFSNILGQQKIKEQLLKSVKNNKVSHAQLFFGPEGVGKLALAIAYAQYINCENPSESDSCGQCSSCRKYEKLVHPDLHFVFPVVKLKPDSVSDDHIEQWRELFLKNPYFTYNDWLAHLGNETKQAGIFVHETSNILKKISLSTYESEYKVMIFWLPEKMNLDTANKLLKILEEPPEKTLFLLVSEDPESIITTVRSRTQPIKIPRISDEALSEYLDNNYTLSDNDKRTILSFAQGSLSKLKKAVDDSDENKEMFKLFVKFMRTVYTFKIQEVNDVTTEISKLSREQLKRFFKLSLRLFRENFMLNIGEEALAILTTEEYNFSKKFNLFINQNNIEQLKSEFEKAFEDISRNGQASIIIYDLAVKTNILFRRKS